MDAMQIIKKQILAENLSASGFCQISREKISCMLGIHVSLLYTLQCDSAVKEETAGMKDLPSNRSSNLLDDQT